MTTTSVTPTTTGELARLRQLAANTIRGLAMDAVQKANSGHPGLPMGMADVATVLWSRFLKFNPADPKWPDRDRFVLSAGHGSMLLYSLLFLSGYDLPLDQLKQFRQWGSKTPGHPEYGLTPGVETTTGPLGQGISNAVGMALAERHLAARFNRPDFNVVNHYTYVIASDGDLMEGISHESCSLAGHLALGKLIVMYDNNSISIDGSTSLAFTDDTVARFQAYGWHGQHVDGHDPVAVEAAIAAAQAETERPSIIACKTHIGYGSPKQDTNKVHGEPLGEADVRITKEKFGFPPDQAFVVPEEAKEFFEQRGKDGGLRQKDWEKLMAGYAQANPELAKQFWSELKGESPAGWDSTMPSFPVDKPIATRAASGKVLDVIGPKLPILIGGSADLTPSVNTEWKGVRVITPDDFSGQYVHYGVREHGMGAIMNGLTVHGGVRAYGATFLIFSDYERPAIRLAALMEIPTIFIFTHDSIGLGEDGPTHQPIEQLSSLRLIPHMAVFRPADATETVECWRTLLNRKHAPSTLVLTRQALPIIDRTKYAPASGVAQGGYILKDAENPQVILIGTGSEVQLALAAQETLAKENIRARVVSMPCTRLFDDQPEAYRESVLPRRIRARVAVEAGATMTWWDYVGLDGAVVGVDRFGASAPGAIVMKELGMTADAVVAAAKKVLSKGSEPITQGWS
ncbi:MAG TPA: transketolase [Terriglobales bacterium]